MFRTPSSRTRKSDVPPRDEIKSVKTAFCVVGVPWDPINPAIPWMARSQGHQRRAIHRVGWNRQPAVLILAFGVEGHVRFQPVIDLASIPAIPDVIHDDSCFGDSPFHGRMSFPKLRGAQIAPEKVSAYSEDYATYACPKSVLRPGRRQSSGPVIANVAVAHAQARSSSHCSRGLPG